MAKIRSLVKKILFPLLHFLRVDGHYWNKPESAPHILFAHWVTDISSLKSAGDFFKGIQAQVLDRREFIRRLQQVQKLLCFMTLDDALENNAKNNIGKSAVMTFDDCYVDFIHVIQPILQKMNIPSVFFITTYGLEQKELLWYDKIYSSIIGTDILHVKIEGLDGVQFSLSNINNKRLTATEICRILWLMDTIQRDNIIKELIEKLGTGPLSPEKLYLSREALIDLSRKPDVTIGSHTVTHPNLMLKSDKDVESELKESKDAIESLAGYPVKHLSYPNGMADERIWKIAQRCGYESACMTKNGTPSNRYGLHRVNIGWGSFSEFSVRISGFLP